MLQNIKINQHLIFDDQQNQPPAWKLNCFYWLSLTYRFDIQSLISYQLQIDITCKFYSSRNTTYEADNLLNMRSWFRNIIGLQITLDCACFERCILVIMEKNLRGTIIHYSVFEEQVKNASYSKMELLNRLI